MAVRYWANGEAVEVGGDFYDAFPIDDETWGLVIGDVCGTGPKAAAITGLARHTIAASAWHGADHSTVLQSLNTTLRRRKADSVLHGALRHHRDRARCHEARVRLSRPSAPGPGHRGRGGPHHRHPGPSRRRLRPAST